MWSDSVDTYTGVSPGQYNFSPAWAKAWIFGRFKQWHELCGPLIIRSESEAP